MHKMEDSLRENPHYRREIEAIALVESCFPEKFGVPRQAGIAPSAEGIIRFLPPYNHPHYIEGIEHYSHLWLTFGFHQNQWNGKAKVRPQRLGGNERMGVFATRSSFRPNGLGLSAVKLESVDYQAMTLTVSGLDLIDGTPIYCIKPYIPFADAIMSATSTFAVDPPQKWPLLWSCDAKTAVIKENSSSEESTIPESTIPESTTSKSATTSMTQGQLYSLIEEVVGQNPIPQFHQDYARIYGVSIAGFNIRFRHIPWENLDSLNGVVDATTLSEMQQRAALMNRKIEYSESDKIPESCIVILEVASESTN
ncbi:tRNA (adenine(37)-N6)-methyltransferase [Ignatzschineria ureiclastica]|nr:tRNA (N6-threonylcarbamoyladenosine(37)-N6)-methyltransferase TrmO [Ignatzschineria ureiclastica]GGZ90192.1 tRNA (adenine(37)-N6)-methyltransferase [Ignatzschineria ureiclastica]